MDGLLDWIKTPEGQGLLSMVAVGMAGAQRGQPINNLGRAFTGGLQGYGAAQERQQRATSEADAKKLRDLQLLQLTGQLEKQAALDKAARDSVIPGIPGQLGYAAPAESEQSKMLMDQGATSDPVFNTEMLRNTNQSLEYANKGAPVPISQGTPAGFDETGYANRMKGIDPMGYYKMMKEGKTSEMKNWDFSKTLSPEDQKLFNAKFGTQPAAIQEWNAYQAMSPKQQAAYLEMKRNPQIVNLGGQQQLLGPGGVPRKSLAVTPKPEDTPEFKAGVAEAVEKAKANVEKNVNLASKQGSVNSLNYVVDQFLGTKDAPGPIYTTTTGGPLGVYGALGKVTDSQQQKRFDNLREQLSTELRTVFRIPGEGTLSDKEQAQYGIQLPQVGNDPALNEQILKDVQARVGLRMGDEPAPATEKPISKTVSLADIAATAKASGKTTAEVTAALKAKGFKIGGK